MTDGAEGEMTMAAIGRWDQVGEVQETRMNAGGIVLTVLRAIGQETLVVAGRVTVDSSPGLRSALLDLLRRCASPVAVVDLSAVSYLDVSGIATLLEALKAARQHSVTLRVIGVSGQSRTLAEIVQLDSIFRAWGSEVEFR